MLGLEPTASEDEIKAAFRRKAKELHPDVNPDVSMAVWQKQIHWSQKAAPTSCDADILVPWPGLCLLTLQRNEVDDIMEKFLVNAAVLSLGQG